MKSFIPNTSMVSDKLKSFSVYGVGQQLTAKNLNYLCMFILSSSYIVCTPVFLLQWPNAWNTAGTE